MEIFIKIVQFLLSLSILVLFHEAGHYLFAKLFKTRVEKFYIFFNPGFSLFKFKKGETEYGLGWIPFGGYVKISGMIDESMDLGQMKEEPKPWEFRSKPAWQRLLIMIGGVVVNIVLAFIIYIGVLFTWGESYLSIKDMKEGVVVNDTFSKMGVKKGDNIIGFDGHYMERFSDIIPNLLLEKPKVMDIDRGGDTIHLNIPESIVGELLDISSRSFYIPRIISPRIRTNGLLVAGFSEYSTAYDSGIRKGDRLIYLNGTKINYVDDFIDANKAEGYAKTNVKILRGKDTVAFSFPLSEDGKMGIRYAYDNNLHTSVKYFSLAESIPAGIKMGVKEIKSYIKQLKLVFSSGKQAAKSVGGFGSIANIFPGVWNWYSFWMLTALISIMVGIMNMLPIPALDGGHVLFILYEIITGRKPGEKFMEYAQMVGMFLILGLFIMANVNDILKFIG